MQKLEILDLRGNFIGDDGTQHLADSLLRNQVKHYLLITLLFLILFIHIDPSNDKLGLESNPKSRS